MKTMTVKDFLTDSEIKKAIKMYGERSEFGFAKRFCDEVIAPNISRINEKLGQKNDPMYLAYAVEYALMASSK